MQPPHPLNLVLRITLAWTWASLPIVAAASDSTASSLLPIVYTEPSAQTRQAATGYIALGDGKLEGGDLDAALADYNQAIRVNPKLAGAYIERGILKMDRGDLDGALADYQAAIQLQPQRFDGYSNIGILEEARSNLGGAFKAFAQAAERVPPGKSRDYIEFAMYLVRAQLGRADEARNSLSSYLDRRHGPPADPLVTNIAARGKRRGQSTNLAPRSLVWVTAKRNRRL